MAAAGRMKLHDAAYVAMVIGWGAGQALILDGRPLAVAVAAFAAASAAAAAYVRWGFPLRSWLMKLMTRLPPRRTRRENAGKRTTSPENAVERV